MNQSCSFTTLWKPEKMDIFHQAEKIFHEAQLSVTNIFFMLSRPRGGVKEIRHSRIPLVIKTNALAVLANANIRAGYNGEGRQPSPRGMRRAATSCQTFAPGSSISGA
jgi:hypothetical protein